MDAHDLWDDTMLLVNTDHGFLLGEHGWWAKSVQPWFNELVHLPMFLWDPRTGGRDTRRGALAQTIDISPTMLRFFDLEPTTDMQGRDLAGVLDDDDRRIRDGALFGVHGGHVNVTDGRWVYMRAADSAANAPLEDFTLMPTHMRGRFGVDELADWQPAEPFAFTKGLRTLRVPAATGWLNSHAHGTLLFDLATAPAQDRPVVDDDAELRMANLLVGLMREGEAPASQYERLGLPATGPVARDHLRARDHAARAAAVAEPLPAPDELRAPAFLRAPLHELLADPAARAVVERHAPDLTRTEALTLPTGASLLDLAAHATVPAATLSAIDDDLTPARVG
ncbi:hypothetical protein [Phytoactinopolyspora endophytica]|uniref:hypothetical protein n=1 Tax=Phytoactinopolyspora endophytica TaxID=1642495 RepID=UPI003B8310F9